MIQIADALRVRRISLGLTQAQIAAAAGLSLRTVSDFEAGGSRISLANLHRLLRATGLELTTREVGRPTLDELPGRYRGEDTPVARQRVRRKATR